MKISNIILNGCSFVHGFDLCYKEFGNYDFENYQVAKSGWTEEQHAIFNNKRLAGRLKNHYNCNVVDLSSSGENNYWIAETTINYLNDNKDNIDLNETIVLIGWTDITRICFNLPDHRDNLSIMHLDGYIEYTEKLKSDPRQEKTLNLYNKLISLKELYHEYPEIINQFYHEHFSLILMIQQYMKSLGVKCVMWNSLPNWPAKLNYVKDYKTLSGIIDWTNFWPYGNIESHDTSWGDSLINKSEKYLTASGHPNELAVVEFTKSLTNFINSRV